MNELRVFNNPCTELPTAYQKDPDAWLGYFYILEYGRWVKIGSTKNPIERYSSLKRTAEKYGSATLGRIGISKPHTNYKESEQILHKRFYQYRISGSELFDVSFDTILSELSHVSLLYKDETQKLEAETDAFTEFAKDMVLNGPRNCSTDVFKNSELDISVRVIHNEDGSISINAEDVALGFGWFKLEKKNGKEYQSIRWDRINGFSAECGFDHKWSKTDYIPEPLFYRLGMKANNERAEKFQNWLSFEVLPAIRKTGSYSVNQNQKPQPQPQSNLEQTLANALLAAQHIISYRDQQLAELQGLIPAGSQPVQIKEPEQLVQIQELEPPKEPDPPKEPEPPEPAAEPKRTYRQRSILATCTQICVKEQILDIAAMNVARQLHCSQNEAIGLIVRYWMWNVKVMDSNGNVPYTSREEVADVLIRGKCDAYTAEEAVDALISTKLISKENGMLQAADWMRWQGMITNAEKLRVQNNRRQREYRRRQKDKSTMEA